ncbi:MAG TPA: DUF6701 domain-containing protein [Pseudomonas sp.]|nr:DUF6701 domain-containing protein [Pseudomonas sp.]
MPVSNSYWKGGVSPTSWRLTTPGSGTARVYVDGNLYIDNNSEINRAGSPSNLIIVVKGDLTIANSANIYVNAMIYVTGNAVIGNNPNIRGAISSGGSMKKGNNIVYDPSAIAGTDFGSLCDNPGAVGQIDHFRFLHAASGLSCNPLDVQLQACATSSCDRLYEGSISATLSPSTWEGGNLVAFNGGQVSLKLHGTDVVTLGIAAVTPAAKNSWSCSTADCKVSFVDSGFIFDVPTLLAGKVQTGITLQAVRKDDSSQRCVPGFGPATRTLQFWSDYVDPGTGTLPVRVNGGAVSGSASAPTSLSLSFDSTATARLDVRYDDAGLMRLNAQYVGSGAESGLLMSGSDQFVSKPYGLHLATDASCSAASVAGCTVLRAAGDSFPLRIRAVAWQADGEPRTAAALADNPSTPNFLLDGIALTSTLAAPAGGDNGSLSPASYNHAGSQTTLDLRESEVGIFTISATPPSGGYFGYTVDGGQSDLVGRFTPAYLQASASAQLTPACGATFSYQQQEIGFATGQTPLLTVTGYNRQGAVTRNYDRGEFWRLSAPQRQDYLSISGRPTLDAAGRLQTLGDAQSTALADASPGDGARQFAWAGDRLRWTAALQPQTDDLPFPGVAGAAIARLALLAAQLRDADGICYDSAGCRDFTYDFGGSEVRLGRLRFGNAFGSELQALDVPFWLESWQNIGTALAPLGGFRPESADSCSAPLLGAAALQWVAGAVQPADFGTPAVLAPLAGQGAVRLPAPGKEGSVSVGLEGLEVIRAGNTAVDLPWLLYDWNADGTTREAARGLATFGIYRGPDALIFRRELYR